MLLRSCKTMLFISVFLFFSVATFAEPQVGQLLEEAMAARETDNLSDVSDKFMIAANAASSYNQRSNVLFIFSDYLIDKRQWEKVIQVQNRIIDYGNPSNQASAFYNIIRANLELKNMDAASIAAIELNSLPAGESMRVYAGNMKTLAPKSIDARIADLLQNTGPDKYYAGSSQLQPTLQSASQFEHSRNENPVYSNEKAGQQFDLKQPTVILGAWNTDLSGNLDSQGMSLDYDRDLSTERETSLILSAEYSPTSQDRFKATYMNFSFSGNLNKRFVHSGKTYNPGAEFYLRSKFLDLEGFRKMQKRSRITFGILYGVMITDSDLEIAQNIPGTRQITTWASLFGYPYLGVAAQSNHGGSIGWEASGKFFIWNGTDKYRTRDLEFKILFGQGSRKLSSRRKFWGFLGYRDFCWDGDFDDSNIELSFSGPILGIEFFF